MDDYGANDMRCEDLTESQLRTHFNLGDVSTKVNPYKLTKIIPFNQSQSMFYGMHGQGDKVTRQECARILFDEFRSLSRPFAVYGPYRYLIDDMINHMQKGSGSPFRSMHLDNALKQQILGDKSEKSTLLRIKKALRDNIDWNRKYYAAQLKDTISKEMRGSVLPKFMRLKDNINGLGITVHDTYATYISLKSLHIDNEIYRVVIHYQIQDHFGLDNNDIMKWQFHQFRFFRIWFVLQRYNQFAFKPFIAKIIEVASRRQESESR